jgi:anti-sigma-K factor RskA
LNYGNHISEEDLSLYAMRALAPPENAIVQRHLDTCAECRGRLADIVGGLALVALAVPQEPLPVGARDRFLKRLHADATVAPQPAKIAAISESEPVSELQPRPQPASSGNWFGSLGWIAAAAALLFAAYLGNNAHNLRRQLAVQDGQIAVLSTQALRTQQIMDALTSPAARRVTLSETKAATQPSAHVMYAKDQGALVFVASHLHPVAANKTYELWLIPANGQAPIPAGLFRPDAGGSASVVLPQLPQGVDAKAFGVTVEEAQGAATPTLPIVMSGQ